MMNLEKWVYIANFQTGKKAKIGIYAHKKIVIYAQFF